ncbi:hypothetical protein RA28_05745 [Ruegeria sp. ANG-S4]|uniref:ABC transporter transmembrane domain-containing protein n=1 Tax=Ruegeria sp. ANG-S4 TaxID=1577904 RepID=UPI00057C81C4|nr:ABC transporter ATP-binding protein [Ruegeria sp. ANG-S4]KIC47185.1 hypothetical protein RA28_05745 [Ruegeria sp. ANG-S4]
MTPLPRLVARDRIIDAVLVVSSSVVQAIALAFAAFATREAFGAIHAGHALAIKTVMQLAISGVVGAACLFLSRYRAEALGQSYAISLRRVLYQQIAQLPKSRHEKRRVGALSLRFVGDLSAARIWFGRGLPSVYSAAVVIPGAAFILYSLDPALAVSGVVALGLSLLLAAALARHLEHRHQRLRQRRANIAISIIERIPIAPELDLMGRTDRELQKLDTQGVSLRNDALARRGNVAGLQVILQLGVAFAGLLMLWRAGETGIAPATVAACLAVMALIALPLQQLASAWDYYCAWQVAREKAQRLLSEPTVKRRIAKQTNIMGIDVTGELDGTPVRFVARPNSVSELRGPNASRLARCVAGYDTHEGIAVRYDDQQVTPKLAFIGDTHIGLQGSLRRSATLMCRKRPSDRRIAKVLRHLGLSDLLRAPEGLDQRVAENGHGLATDQTLRLDLARAVLGNAEVVVIASIRWIACQHQVAELLATFRKLSSATIILADDSAPSKLHENSKVI